MTKLNQDLLTIRSKSDIKNLQRLIFNEIGKVEIIAKKCKFRFIKSKT